MSDSDRGKFFASGLVAGLGLALLFLVWTVPEFRAPLNHIAKPQTQSENSKTESKAKTHYKAYRFDVRPYVSREDTIAQWIMSIFTVILTLLTGLAVWFVYRTAQFTRDTLTQAEQTNKAAWETVNVTRDIGHAEARGYFKPVSVRINAYGVAPISGTSSKPICWVAPKFSVFGNTPIKNLTIRGNISVQKNNAANGTKGPKSQDIYAIPFFHCGDTPPKNKVFAIEAPTTTVGKGDFVSVALEVEYWDVFGNCWLNRCIFAHELTIVDGVEGNFELPLKQAFTTEEKKASES